MKKIKEIIIDGVNVANCKYFWENPDGRSRLEYENVCCAEQDPCCDCPNCYFKQLAKKEREIKILNECLDVQKVKIDELTNTNKFLSKCLQTQNNNKLRLREIIKNIREFAKNEMFYDTDRNIILEKTNEVIKDETKRHTKTDNKSSD